MATKKCINKSIQKKSQNSTSASHSTSNKNIKKDNSSVFINKIESSLNILQTIKNGYINNPATQKDTLKIFFDDFYYILKEVPKIKNTSFLNEYIKLINDFSIMINLSESTITSINENKNKDNLLDFDENKVLIEKIIYNDKFYYKIRNNKNDTDFIISSEEGGILIKNFNCLVYNNENEHSVVEFVFIDKIVYNNSICITSLPTNRLDINVLKLFFEIKKYQNILKKYENNNILNITINLNRQSVEDKKMNEKEDITPVSLENKLLNSVIESNSHDASEHMPLLCDKAFPKYEKSILAAPTKSGKSYLSIELGLSKNIKNPLYIFVDDIDDFQLERYKIKLGDKASIINYKYFNNAKEMIENNNKNKKHHKDILLKLCLDNMNIDKAYYKIYKYVFENMIDEMYGNEISENNLQIMILKNIINNILKEKGDIDFICIDSLKAFFGSPQKIKREVIDEIIKLSARCKSTLLIINHTNNNGKMYKYNEIAPCFENEYMLSSTSDINNNDDDNYIKSPKIYYLKLNMKPRTSSEGNIYLKQIFIDKYLCNYEVISKTEYEKSISNNKSSDISTNKKFINEVFEYIKNKGKKGCSFDELFNHFSSVRPKTSRDSLQNQLRTLRGQKRISEIIAPWKKIICKIHS